MIGSPEIQDFKSCVPGVPQSLLVLILRSPEGSGDENDITRELTRGIVTLWEIRDTLHLLI